MSAKVEISARQRQVLKQLHLGATNRVIAQTLNMTETAVAGHIRELMAKLGARNRTQVVLLTERLIIEPDEAPSGATGD